MLPHLTLPFLFFNSKLSLSLGLKSCSLLTRIHALSRKQDSKEIQSRRENWTDRQEKRDIGGDGKPPCTPAHLEYVKREISTIVFRDFRMQAFCRLGLRGENLRGKFSPCSLDTGRKRALLPLLPDPPDLVCPPPGLRLLASTAGP